MTRDEKCVGHVGKVVTWLGSVAVTAVQVKVIWSGSVCLKEHVMAMKRRVIWLEIVPIKENVG